MKMLGLGKMFCLGRTRPIKQEKSCGMGHLSGTGFLSHELSWLILIATLSLKSTSRSTSERILEGISRKGEVMSISRQMHIELCL